jgi:hypothetical protein
LPDSQKYGRFANVKTTLEIPSELYRQARIVAATENVRLKDLVAEGLRLALSQRAKNSQTRTPLEWLREARQQPQRSPEEIQRMMDASTRSRAEGWNREDAG